MHISIDNQEVFSLSEIDKKIIQNDIPAQIFDEDIRRRVRYIIEHKLERCMERLRQEWMPKLKDRVASIPTDDKAFAQLVFSQPDYKNRSQRDLESDSLK